MNISFENQKSPRVKNFFEKVLIISKRSPNLIEVDIGGEFYKVFFQNFLNKNNIKIYSRNTSLGTVLQNVSIVITETFIEKLFLKKEMLIGLMFYLH